MLSDVDDAYIRRVLEGSALVGAMSIEYPDGQKVTIDADGNMIRESDPIDVEWCDKCESYKTFAKGAYEKADGLTILWFCEACK